MKPLPYWLKGGLIGLGVYFLSVIISLSLLIIPESFFNFIGSGGVIFLPFLLIDFYPALLIHNNYEALWFIIPFNALFYFLLGMFVARALLFLRNYRLKSQH